MAGLDMFQARSFYLILILFLCILPCAEFASAGCDPVDGSVRFTPESYAQYVREHCSQDDQEKIRRHDRDGGIPKDRLFKSGSAGITWEEFRNMPRRMLTPMEIGLIKAADERGALPLTAGLFQGWFTERLNLQHPVYVLGSAISVIDGGRDEFIRDIRLPSISSSFSVNPGGNLVVNVRGRGDMFSPAIREIYVLTPEGRKAQRSLRLKHVPDDLYLSADGRYGLVTHNRGVPGRNNPLTLADIVNRKELRVFDVPGAVRGALYDNEAFVFYVSGWRDDGEGSGIYRIDLKDMTLSKTLDVKENYLRASFRGGKLYGLERAPSARNQGDDVLRVVDIKTGQVEKSLPLMRNIYDMVFVEDMLYITHYQNRGDHVISIVNTNTYEIENVLDVEKGAAAICYDRNLGKVYTANMYSDSVSVIDVKLRAVVKEIPLKQRVIKAIRCPE